MRFSGARFLWYLTNTFSEYCIFLHSEILLSFSLFETGCLYVDQDGLQLTEIPLFLPPKYWD